MSLIHTLRKNSPYIATGLALGFINETLNYNLANFSSIDSTISSLVKSAIFCYLGKIHYEKMQEKSLKKTAKVLLAFDAFIGPFVLLALTSNNKNIGRQIIPLVNIAFMNISYFVGALIKKITPPTTPTRNFRRFSCAAPAA